MPAAPARSDDPLGLVGQLLAGRFQVERFVAEGGFGLVYRARQLVLDRPVALKVFKPSSEIAGDRFAREARTVARLKHPNIVEVYDFGGTQLPSGASLHWMALEWLEGRTLQEFLDQRHAQGASRLEPQHALELLGPVIQAIAAAHRAGVVHRDLKPSNIILVEQHDAVVAKVLDFGIAQIRAGEKPQSAETLRPATRPVVSPGSLPTTPHPSR